MNLIDALLGEHGAVRCQLEHLRKSLQGMPLDILKAEFGVVAAVLETHAKLEDDLIFKGLQSKLDFPDTIHHEHEVIHDLVSRVMEQKDASDARRLLVRVMEAVERHFEKEEKVLFPAAVRTLDAARLTQAATLWAERRRVTA
jgi:hemerythrin-like domain-containing protein